MTKNLFYVQLMVVILISAKKNIKLILFYSTIIGMGLFEMNMLDASQAIRTQMITNYGFNETMVT